MKRGFFVQCVLVSAAVMSLYTMAAANQSSYQCTAALAWLENTQDSESGSWSIDSVRDTALVLQTLQLFPDSGVDAYAAQVYLSEQQPVSTDYLSRKSMALAVAGLSVMQDVDELLLRQNPDGGFGFLEGYPSSPFDSLMALDAFISAGVDDDTLIASALGYLTALQYSSGAFAYGIDGPASLEVTCRALLVMHSLQPRYDLSFHITQAADFIATRQNADGGFGEQESTVVETSLALQALQAAGLNAQAVSGARAWLLAVQSTVDGSWNARVRDTALALAALHESDGIERANLQVQSSGIILQPSYPAAGQQVTLSCDVLNSGSIAAENILVELYLGDSQAGGRFLVSGSIAQLAAGSSATVQLAFTLGDEPGQADVYVVVDPHNLIEETSTEDNVSVKSFTAGTLPDLVISGIDVSTASAQADEPFTVSASVQNLGESDAGPVVVGLYPGDPAATLPLLEVELDNVCGGCSGRADFELSLLAGTYEYVVAVSTAEGVVESNLDNNDRACAFTVGAPTTPGLDLAVTQAGIIVTPAYPREGEPLSIAAVISNNGTVAAHDAEVEIYAVDDAQLSTLLHTFTGVDVGAGGSVTLTLNGVQFAAGTHKIFVQATASAVQEDVATGNNIASKTLSVLDVEDVVDVAVDDLTFSPSMPHAGDSVIVKFRVTNNGNVGLSGITFGVYDNDPLAGGMLLTASLQTLGRLDAGQSMYASGAFNTTGRGGEQTFFVFIDAARAVGEVDEDNNITAGSFTVVHDPGADIVVNAGSLEFSPAQPSVGDDVRIDCTVYNQGLENINESFQMALYAGQPQAGTQPVAVATVDALVAHTYSTIVFTTQASLFAASQSIFVDADYQNTVVETNEYNNTVSANIAVTAPDLEIRDEDIAIDSGTLLPGQVVTLNATVHNIGQVDADGVTVVVFNGPSENTQEIVRQNLSLVAAAGSVVTAFSISLPEGTYDLHVVIDPDELVPESNITNNRASIAVAVGLPDDYSADLSAVSLNVDNFSCDTRSLIVSGSVTAAFSNSGPDAINLPFRVIIFEDRNTNNVFDQGEDAVLGSVEITESVESGAVISTEIQLYGSLLFVGNRLHMFVDSESAVAELDENNNTTHSMASCVHGAGEEPCIDISASHVRLDKADVPDSATVTVRVGNGGAAHVGSGIGVALYDGNPADSAVLLGTVQTSGALVAGAYEDVSFILEQPSEGDYNLFAVVDDDGNGQGQLTEINEANNTAFAAFTITSSVNPKDTSVSQGAHWLVEHQHHLGGWDPFKPAWSNAAALHALYNSGMYIDAEFSDMYATLLQRVYETQATNGSWENNATATADSVLALLAVGEDSSSPAITNAVIWLKRYLQNGWENYPPSYVGLALWALMEAGVDRDDSAVQITRQWLLDTCNSSGYWGSRAGVASSTWTLHYPVVALQLACDESDSVAQAVIAKAVNWYENNMKLSPIHTQAYLNMLYYTGLNTGDIEAMISKLASLQSSNGGWIQYSLSVTPLEEPQLTSDIVISLYRHSETGGGAAIRKAFQWLKNMMVEPDGDFLHPYDEAGSTSLALLALNSINDGGEFNESIGEALVRLVNTQKNNGNWYPQLSQTPDHVVHAGSSALRGLGETELTVAGKDNAVSEVVDFLFANQNSDGGWHITTNSGSSYVNITIGCLLALLFENVDLTVDQKADVQQAIDWLLQQKTGTANWAYISYTADTVKILEKFGGYQSEIDVAVAWLKQQQNPDGGWGEYESTITVTARVLLALIQSGNQGVETARAAQWLLAVQNFDGGWPILPGLPNSSTNPTAFAVRALALAEYAQGPELEIRFDNAAYKPGETVTIFVEAKDDSFQVQEVTGFLKEYGDQYHNITLAKVGSSFIGTHVLSATHLAGTDVVSIEAQTLEGVPGYASAVFTVANTATALADLSITASDIMFSPELPDEGRIVLIAAQVHNTGSIASDPVAVRFLNGTQQIGSDQALGSLEPGESEIVFMQWDTYGQTGRNYIHVVVDPDQAVADDNRVNNSAMRPIEVVERVLPDLQVDGADVTIANSTPIEGAEVEVSATVSNRGAAVDGIVVHFYDGTVAAENLFAERIIHEVVPFGGSVTVPATYDTAGLAGEHTIIVKADGVNAIREQDETNNIGSVLLDVAANGLTLELGLDREQYYAGEDVMIAAEIVNNVSVERTIILDVAVLDSAGAVLAWPAQERIIVLAPGATVVLDDLVWNTGSTLAGAWTIVANVVEDAQRRAEISVSFSILADMSITASVQPGRQVYYDHEQVVISSMLRSYSPNYVFTDLSAVVEVISSEGQVLFTHTQDIAQLNPLFSTTWQQGWNTPLNPPGLYMVTMRVMHQGSLIVAETAFVTIAGSSAGGRGLSATMNAEPGQVYRGQDIHLSYSVINSGNVALDELELYFKAVTIETQETVVEINGACVFDGTACSGTAVIETDRFACGEHLTVLGALVDGIEKNLAFAPLSVINRCPVAVAGQDLLGYVGDVVQLDGSSSYDVDGDALSYSWEIVSAPEGSSAQLAGSDQYNAALVMDRNGTYELRLIVADGMCMSPSDSVLVTTHNRSPIAVAGENLLVDVGQAVQLDASASYDPDMDALEHYEWTLVSRPALSTAVLSDRFAVDPVFTADMPGAYRLQLVVRDFEYASDPVELYVTTRNRIPVADCGADQEVYVGAVVQLDATASYDPDLDVLTYRWALLSIPAGSQCALDNATAQYPVLAADKHGAYIAQLIVNDGEFDSIPVTCIITTTNRPPVALATADPEEVERGGMVSLSASLSSDPDGDVLACSWQIVSAPEGSAAVIEESDAFETAFSPDLPGDYLIMLLVEDVHTTSSAQIMIKAIEDNPPECADNFGAAVDYSIFALSGIELNNAVVAGRIAAGGDVVLQNVVVGKHADIESPAEAVLVAGGDIDYSKGTVHSGSILAAGSIDGVSDKVRRSLAAGASVTGYAQLPFDFDAEAVNLRQLSARLAGLEPTGTIEQSSTTLTLRGDSVSDTQIFSIDLQQVVSASSLHLKDIGSNTTIIINVAGEGTISNTGIAFPGWLHDRVVFNFYEAISLAFRSLSLKGSVLAPYAGVTAESGVIFGNIFVDTYEGSVTVGQKPFTGQLPECNE